MPNLNQLLADPNLFPQDTGQPTGVVPVPSVGLAQDTGAPGGLGAGLSVIGQGLEHLGQGLAHRAQFEAVQRKAQVVLFAQDAENQARQKLDTYAAQSLRDPDVQGHPERLRTYADQIEAEYGQVMPPDVRQRFTAEFGKYRAVLNNHAEKQALDGLTTQAKMTLDDLEYRATDGVLNAPDEGRATVELLRYKTALRNFAETGLIFPDEADLRYRKFFDTLNEKRQQAAIVANPMGMLQQAQAASMGTPQNEALPTLKSEDALKVHKLAHDHLARQAQDMERAHRQAEAVQAKVQDATARQLFADLTSIPLTQENVGAFDPMIRKINAMATSGQITTTHQREALADARRLQEVARNPPQIDNQEAVGRITIMALRAQTPADLVELGRRIVSEAHQVSPGKLTELFALAETRKNQLQYSSQPGYRHGVELIQGTFLPDIPPQMGPPGASRVLSAQETIVLARALSIYDSKLMEIAHDPKQGPVTMNAQAVEVARDVIEKHILPAMQDKKSQLLPSIREVGNRQDAIRILVQDRTLSNAIREQQLRLHGQIYPLAGQQPTPRGSQTPAQPPAATPRGGATLPTGEGIRGQ